MARCGTYSRPNRHGYCNCNLYHITCFNCDTEYHIVENHDDDCPSCRYCPNCGQDQQDY